MMSTMEIMLRDVDAQLTMAVAASEHTDKAATEATSLTGKQRALSPGKEQRHQGLYGQSIHFMTPLAPQRPTPYKATR